MFSIKSIKKRILGFSNSEKGFTLIEIIAVLVILGILAAVALPRYASIQDAARTLSAQAGVNELIGRANVAYAQEVAYRASQDPILNLSNIDHAAVANRVNAEGLGDYLGTYSDLGLITINQVQGQDLDPDVTHSWDLPVF